MRVLYRSTNAAAAAGAAARRGDHDEAGSAIAGSQLMCRRMNSSNMGTVNAITFWRVEQQRPRSTGE